jgi:hypothetical protein
VQTEPNAASDLTFLLAHKALIFSKLSLMIRFMGLVEQELITHEFSLPFLRRLLSGAEQPLLQKPLPRRLDAPEKELNLPEIRPDLRQLRLHPQRMRLDPEQLSA